MLQLGILLAAMAAITNADDYVENLSCGSDGLTFILKDNSSFANATFNNPEGVIPSGVLVIKEDWPLGDDCSALVVGNSTVARTIHLNYDRCHVSIVQPEGAPGIANIDLVGTDIFGMGFQNFTFSVYCVYPSSVTQDAGGFTVTEKAGGGGGGHGGSDIPGLVAKWTYMDNTTIDNPVHIHDEIKFQMSYTGTVYKKIWPESCYFSDKKQGKNRIPFVKGGCPEKIEDVYMKPAWNNTYYEQPVRAFEFRTTYAIWAHCNVNLCAGDKDPNCDGSSCEKVFLQMLMSQPGGGDGPKNKGYAYASLKLYKPSGGDSGGGGSPTSTLFLGIFGGIAGVLVIAVIVVLVVFGRGRTAGAVAPQTADTPWSIPRVKMPEKQYAVPTY